MVGGFMIAVVLIGSALFVGTWFSSAVHFQDSHTLDAARETRPVACSFNISDDTRRTTGYIHARDGYMRFDIHDVKDIEVADWGVELNMHDPSQMMTRSAEGEPYVSLDSYADLRVQILDNVRMIMQSERIHCAPWWGASGFRFALEGKIFR